MKQELVRGIRKALPQSTVKIVEEVYRKSRTKLISAKYGHPAKKLKIIAITGTNGKTTTAGYINEILKQAGKKTALFSTALIEINGQAHVNDLNATVGTVSQMYAFFKKAKKQKVDFVIIEATSHALHQHKLDGLSIEAAVMTNLTQDHLDYHGTMENYAAAKAILFKKNPKYIVLNHDDQWFEYFDKFEAKSEKMNYGQNDDAEAKMENIKLYKRGAETDVTFDHQTKLNVATHLPGEYNLYNATAAAAVCYLMGTEIVDIKLGIANLKQVPGRFERIQNERGFDVVVDYAHTPDAFDKLLDTARAITKNRVIIVFGATGDRDKTKRPIMGKIAAQKADRIFITDEESYNENPDQIRAAIMKGIAEAKGISKTEEIADRRQAIAKALSVARRGDTILVTGMGHEKYRIVDGKRIPWNDKEVVEQILSEQEQAKQ